MQRQITNIEYSELPKNQKWEKLKGIITSTAENVIGFKKKLTKHQCNNDEIEKLSLQQKQLRLQIESGKCPEKIKDLRKSRKEILKQIQKKVKEANEKRIEALVDDIESAKDDTRMFKAIKLLTTKHTKIKFVHDENQHCVSQPQEMQKIIERHFKDHFQKNNLNGIDKFACDPKKLNKEISPEEIKTAISKMSNNKAPGKDNIDVELVKYAPEEVHTEIAEVLNNVFETNDDQLKLGTGVLLPLPKPKKTQGPTKHLRPITLLEVIRKVLSKVFMSRTDDKINNHLSQSQSAYRKSRSTTDAVWAHRWMAAKAQEQDISIHITGIDMSSAFDTIYRDVVIKIAEKILDEDEVRILRVLLADTTLEVKIDNAESSPFVSNIGSPQGDSISGPLFTIYLDDVILLIKEALEKAPIDCRDINRQLLEKIRSEIPSEILYADDCDFITEIEKMTKQIYEIAKTILKEHNLLVNDDKTENTIVKRGSKEDEREWRNTIKLGSKLGDREDIKRRKELSNVALANNKDIWKLKHKTKRATRIRIYETAVKSILLYNSGTWGLSKGDRMKLDSFHRRQLRKVIGMNWPHKISNKKLYEVTGSKPLSITITERRWKLLGHIMRLPSDCPARKAMRYFFEKRSNKLFRGRKRTTIYTTLNEDIRRTKLVYPEFPVIKLVSQVSLQNMNTKARNRKLWAKIVGMVVESAHSELQM